MNGSDSSSGTLRHRRRAARAASTRLAASACEVREILAQLERLGSRKNREGMARYGIVAEKVFGVSVASLHAIAKRCGRSHALASALWKTAWFEARMLAAFVDEPDRVTPAQMDRWARAFENWAICDTHCMHLFDRTPHAWRKVGEWARRDEEFVRRAAFALLAALAAHDRTAPDASFRKALRLVERQAGDDRNFVKKAVNWALRAVGNRNRALHADAMRLARRLAGSDDPCRRWIGRDALRDLSRPVVARRLESRARATRA